MCCKYFYVMWFVVKAAILLYLCINVSNVFVVQPMPKGDHVLNFCDAEDMIDDKDLVYVLHWCCLFLHFDWKILLLSGLNCSCWNKLLTVEYFTAFVECCTNHTTHKICINQALYKLGYILISRCNTETVNLFHTLCFRFCSMVLFYCELPNCMFC